MRIGGTRAHGSERGAIAIIVALSSVVMMTSAAFAMDLGMLRAARSDLQALADVVSLDLSRDLNGVGTPQSFNTKWATLSDTNTMQQALLRNPVGLGQSTSAEAPWICSARACVMAAAGYVDSSGVFHQALSTDTTSPTAVKVTAQGKVPFGFAQMAGVNSGTAARSAVGIGVPQSSGNPTPVSTSSNACVAVGSYLLRASTGTSPLLNGLIGKTLVGNNANATLVGYQGIATAQVNVGKLAADTTLGTVNQPLSTSVSLGTLLTAIANASPSSAQASIATFRTLVSVAGKLNMNVGSVGNVLNINNSGALANATVTAGELLAAAASVVNGQNVADTGAQVTLGGVVLTASVKVIQPPQIGCYPNAATTGQVQVNLTGSQLLLGTVTIKLGLAQASAVASTITCTGFVPTAMGVTLSNQSAATAEVDATSILGVLGLPLGVQSQLTVGAVASSAQTLVLPTYYDPTFYPANPTATTLVPNVSGLLSALLLGALNPIISDLDSNLLSTASNTLGINLAGADLAAEPTPSCVTPSLGG